MDIHLATLRLWLRKYRHSGKIIVPVEEADLRKRLAEVERVNTRLRIERDTIKAAAIFAKETL